MITISYSGAHKLNDALRIASTKWILPVIKPFFFASLVAAKRHSVFVTWHLAFRTNLQPSCHIYEAEFLWEQDRCKQSAVVLRLAWRHKPPPTDQKGEWRLPILGHEKVYFQASFHSKGSPPYSFSYVTFHSVVRHLQSLATTRPHVLCSHVKISHQVWLTFCPEHPLVFKVVAALASQAATCWDYWTSLMCGL